jgi:Na+-driven multidrug efflux pump
MNSKIIFLIIWAVLAISQAIYRFIFQYKTRGYQPYDYRKVKKILHWGEIIALCPVSYSGIEEHSYWLAIPIAMLLRFFINFIAFKRESDKLFNFYIEHKVTGNHNDALNLANDQINRDIERKERI